MLRKLLTVALVATAVPVAVGAQGRPPAEMPPAGFAGQQYIDSRGCLYIRAGHGGQVNWVARIDRARRPICGQTPSLNTMASARRELTAESAAVAPAPAPVVRAAPVVDPSQYVPPPVVYGQPRPLAPRTAAPAPQPQPQPQQQPQPQRHAEYHPANDGYLHGWYRDIDPQYESRHNPNLTPPRGGVVTPSVGGHPPTLRREQGCPADAPHGRVYELADGRNMMLCSNKPHALRNARESQPVGRAASARSDRVTVRDDNRSLRMVQGDQYEPAGGDLMTPPPGYRKAWNDDRLNPDRARGTPEGEVQMAQVWTETVPQRLRHPAYAQPSRPAATSSKAQRSPVAAISGARFVQVGSYAVPENAARAVARLQSLGMPVQIARGQIKGKPVQVVRAGPFAGDQAQAALTAARRAGYSDAILR